MPVAALTEIDIGPDLDPSAWRSAFAYDHCGERPRRTNVATPPGQPIHPWLSGG
jgi:hypothetical protein